MAGMGWGKIAQSLNNFGYKTRKGNRFYKQTVKRKFKKVKTKNNMEY